jgi:methyl-accepting chemotaxis protein
MTEKRAVRLIRKKYLIDKKFQAIFILKFVLVLVAGGILSIVITLLTTESTLTSSFEGSRLVIEKTSIAILPSVIMTNIIATSVVGIMAVLITLLLSHKIAGPMFRFSKDLDEISQGNFQKKIQIRKGDQFESVAISLNTMVTNLNEKICEIQQELEKVTESATAKGLPQKFVNELKACKMNIELKFKL